MSSIADQAPLVSVVIVNYETSDFVKRCVESLAGQEPSHEIIVVDNPSVAEDWRKLPESVRLVRMPENGGYGLGCNAGVAAADARSRYVCILNPDIVVPAGELAKWIAAYEDDGILAPRLLNENGTIQKSTYAFPGFFSYWANHSLMAGILKHLKKSRHAKGVEHGPHSDNEEVDWVVGAALLMDRPTWNAVQGFHPNYFLYSEDTDICYRVRLAGLPVQVTGAAQLIHTQGNPAAEVRDVAMLRLFSGIKTFLHHHYTLPGRAATKLAVILDMLIRIPAMTIAGFMHPTRVIYRKRLTGAIQVLRMYLRWPI